MANPNLLSTTESAELARLRERLEKLVQKWAAHPEPKDSYDVIEAGAFEVCARQLQDVLNGRDKNGEGGQS